MKYTIIPFDTAISAGENELATVGGSEGGEIRVNIIAEEKHNLAILATEDIASRLHGKWNHDRDLYTLWVLDKIVIIIKPSSRYGKGGRADLL